MNRQARLELIKKYWNLRKKNGKLFSRLEIATKIGCSIHTLKADLSMMRKQSVDLKDRRLSSIDWEKLK